MLPQSALFVVFCLTLIVSAEETVEPKELVLKDGRSNCAHKVVSLDDGARMMAFGEHQNFAFIPLTGFGDGRTAKVPIHLQYAIEIPGKKSRAEIGT